MFRTSAGTLFLVLRAAFLAPLISARFRSLRLPAPVFVTAVLVVRGLPVLLYRRGIPERRTRWSLAMFSATGLALILFPVIGNSLAPRNAKPVSRPGPSNRPDPAV